MRFLARFFEPLLHRLLPATGTHRTTVVGERWSPPPVSVPVHEPPHALPCRPARTPAYGGSQPGGGGQRVRPYVLTDTERAERAAERRRQRQRPRRRELWLATRGIDLGVRAVHGTATRMVAR